MVNTLLLFNKVSGENEKCLLFLFKNQMKILANPIYDCNSLSQPIPSPFFIQQDNWAL